MLIQEIEETWIRTYNNCKFYYDENRPIALANEIGVLRGIYYTMEIIGMDLEEHLEQLKDWIKYQEQFKREEVENV